MCAYKRKSPLPITEGGTEKQSFTANTVICAGTTSTGPLQNVASVGSHYDVLTSQGAGSLPQWTALSNATFFESLSADPTSPTNFQVWYNTTTNLFKGYLPSASNTWTAKTSLNTAVFGTSGTQIGSDALCFGGESDLVPLSPTNATQLYSTAGNTWTTKTAMNTATSFASGASLDSDNSLAFCGNDTPLDTGATQLYNVTGNTWTTKTSNSTPRNRLGGCSLSSTTALAFGGQTPTVQTTTDLYDLTGNTWTSKTGLSSAVTGNTGMSINSGDAFSIGGTGPVAATEKYSTAGNSWSSGGSLNLARVQLASAGLSGDKGLVFGGENGSGTFYAETEIYSYASDTFTNDVNMNTARGDYLGGAALSSSTALSFGGYAGSSPLATTELYSSASASVVTFTVT